MSRDKRGYEHIYLIDATARRGKTSRPRVLYWFRTPPGVMVGREPFDEPVRRTLEAHYPDVTFDWEQLRKTAIATPDVEPWRERRRVERAARQARQAGERDETEATPQLGVPEVPEVPDVHEVPGGLEIPGGREILAVPGEETLEPLELLGVPVEGAAIQAAPSETTPLQAEQRRRRRRGGRRRRPSPRPEGASSGAPSNVPKKSESDG